MTLSSYDPKFYLIPIYSGYGGIWLTACVLTYLLIHRTCLKINQKD